MTTRDALLAAVAAAPADDTPKLVYADWLEEHSDDPADRDRVEFIRLAVRVAHLPDDHPDRAAVLKRVEALFRQRADGWFGPPLTRRTGRGKKQRTDTVLGPVLALPPAATEPALNSIPLAVTGGFVTRVNVHETPAGWLGVVARVVNAEPVGVLRLFGGRGVEFAGLAEAMADWPGLARVRAFTPAVGLPPEDVARLVHNPHLTGVRSLDLTGWADGAVAGWADGPLAGRLTELKLPTAGPGAVGLVNRSAVVELTPAGQADDDGGAFFRAVANPSIRRLNAGSKGFRDAALDGLLGSPVLPQLTAVDFRGNFFSARALAHFYRVADLGRLTELRTGQCIGQGRERAGEVWAAILAAPWADRLTALDVGWRPGLTAADLQPLAAGRLPKLEELSVGPAELGDAGAKVLAGAACRPTLRELYLWECGLTDAGAKVLAAADFPAMVRLNIRGNPGVGPAGARALAKRYGPRAVFDPPSDG